MSHFVAGDKTVYSTEAYFEQLCEDIDSAQQGDRVLLTTMTFETAEPRLVQVMRSLGSAVKRGAAVDLQVDAYPFMLSRGVHPGPLWRSTAPLEKQKLSKPFQPLYEPLSFLSEAGATVTITNPPTRAHQIASIGRSHIKISVINDVTYQGGCNMNALHTDCMVRRESPRLADWLYNLMRRRTVQPHSRKAWGNHDMRLALTDEDEYILDVGVRNQSAIYDEALDVIDRAEKWLLITCQYSFAGKTARHLQAAYKRGVNVLPIFNHSSHHDFPGNLLQGSVTATERFRMPQRFFESQIPKSRTYAHIKVLASESESMVGSHNYINAGVRFGTAELALHSKDPAFTRGLAQFTLGETMIKAPADFFAD